MALLEMVEPFGPFPWAVIPTRPARRMLAALAVALMVAALI